MAKISKQEYKIAKELVTTNARDASLSIPGVSDVVDVKVGLNKEKEELIVDLFIKVKFGEKIPALSWDVQTLVNETIKKSFEGILEIKINKINIHIAGVN